MTLISCPEISDDATFYENVNHKSFSNEIPKHLMKNDPPIPDVLQHSSQFDSFTKSLEKVKALSLTTLENDATRIDSEPPKRQNKQRSFLNALPKKKRRFSFTKQVKSKSENKGQTISNRSNNIPNEPTIIETPSDSIYFAKVVYLTGSDKNIGSHNSSATSLPELPFSTNLLQHLGKSRPKRKKNHAPKRGAFVLW